MEEKNRTPRDGDPKMATLTQLKRLLNSGRHIAITTANVHMSKNDIDFDRGSFRIYSPLLSCVHLFE